MNDLNFQLYSPSTTKTVTFPFPSIEHIEFVINKYIIVTLYSQYLSRK